MLIVTKETWLSKLSRDDDLDTALRSMVSARDHLKNCIGTTTLVVFDGIKGDVE